MPAYALGTFSPQLPPKGSFWIAPDAHVIGQVTLGSDVGVWFGAVLRGDNEPMTFGDRSNIQEGVIAHTDVGFPLRVGRGCTIGHHAILHGCLLGDNVLVGMGATVMNGAQIGQDSIVGAGALVTEGKSYPARSLIVGIPAKTIRTLDEATVEMLKSSATHYVAAWRRFDTDLRRLD